MTIAIADIDLPPIASSNFSAQFWEASRDGRLLLQYCPVTHQYQFYPRPLSLYTARRALEWRESPGLGALYSYTISRIGRGAFADATPFAIGLVALHEGPHIMGAIVSCALDELRIGMAMKPYWRRLDDGRRLLLFQPDRDAATPAHD